MNHSLMSAMLLVTALASPLPAQPRAEVVRQIDGPVRVDPYKLVRLGPIAPDGVQVDWDVSPAENVDTERLPDGRLLFVGPPGKYTVRRWAIDFKAQKFERSTHTVTIGDPDPVPPPTPPVPNDPLARELQTLYSADTGATKSQDLALLAELFAQAGTLADDQSITVLGSLADRIAAASRTLARDRLASVRQRIGTEITNGLGDDPDKPLDAATRAAAKTLFARIHTFLKGIK